MTTEEAIREVNEIFKEVLENESIVIDYNTSAEDIPEWDSLNHIMLVVEIEQHFKIRFKSSEIQSFANVGEMCDSIVTKI